MNRPLKVEPKSGFRLRLVYPNGIEGVIDLSSDVGQGVFAPLADEAFFRTVHIGEYGQISWTDDIEMCSDAAYAELTSNSLSCAHA
ncbi:MAG: DUF2442 domain-containing protein [Verrucomicrobiota bacterium]